MFKFQVNGSAVNKNGEMVYLIQNEKGKSTWVLGAWLIAKVDPSNFIWTKSESKLNQLKKKANIVIGHGTTKIVASPEYV